MRTSYQRLCAFVPVVALPSSSLYLSLGRSPFRLHAARPQAVADRRLVSTRLVAATLWVLIIVSRWACLLYMFMTPFASHIWCLDHLDGLTHLSCISRLTKMSKMTNTFYILLMWGARV